jgi:hypothetical protein
MHSAVPVIVAAALIVLVEIERHVAVLYEQTVTRRHWHPSLFTRPPPSI